MLGSHFYNQIVRKNIIAFGTLFNNIEMKSTDPNTGEVLETQKVPLNYGPKQKFLVRLAGNNASSKVAITLPRIYFEMNGIEYDSTRKTSPIQQYKTIVADNGNEVKVQYVPVPYNLNFELGISTTLCFAFKAFLILVNISEIGSITIILSPDYKLAFLTPGIKPSLANFLKAFLLIPNFLINPLALPVIGHLLYSLTLNFCFLLAFTFIDFFAIIIFSLTFKWESQFLK